MADAHAAQFYAVCSAETLFQWPVTSLSTGSPWCRGRVDLLCHTIKRGDVCKVQSQVVVHGFAGFGGLTSIGRPGVFFINPISKADVCLFKTGGRYSERGTCAMG